MKRTDDVNHRVGEHLTPEQALLFSALREEFNAKLGSLKAWGVAALVGGQVVGIVTAAYIGPAKVTNSAAHAAVVFVHLI